VAGDGVGTVQVSWYGPLTAGQITANPAQNMFTNTITMAPAPNAVNGIKAPFTISSTTPIPALAPGLYIMQAAKAPGGSWVSCSTVTINAAPAPGQSTGAPAPAQGVVYAKNCQPLSGTLPFCGGYGVKSGATPLSIDVGGNPLLAQDMIAFDATVKNTYLATLNSSLVFGAQNKGTQACMDSYGKWLCAYNYPLCGNPYNLAGCKASCYQMSSDCDLQDSHKGLYDCASDQVTGSDSAGTCAPCTGACALTLSGSHLSYSLVLLAGLVAAALGLQQL